MHGLDRITEVHPATPMKVHPADLLKDVIPERAWVLVVNAIVKGLKKHGVWDSAGGRKKYVEHALNHLAELDAGETWDEDDGHHHASALIIRGFQILDAECLEGG